MVHHNACPLCSSEETGILFMCRDHFVSNEYFNVVKCSSCGFIFTQDHPDEADMGPYYESEEYISHSDTSEGLYNKLYHIAREIMLNKKRKLILKSTGLNYGKILDIGSGTGFFADIMKRAGWEVKCVEINDKARNYSISHFGLEAVSPDELRNLPAESFDCVTLWHVLEHFSDPFMYAKEIIRVLKPGAICVVALPNCSSYDAIHYHQYWAAWDVPRHLWHFNPTTFRLFTDKTGFITEDIKKLPLDVFYISILSEKYKGSFLQFIQGMFKASIYFCLSAVNKKKNSSVIYILRKPAG